MMLKDKHCSKLRGGLALLATEHYPDEVGVNKVCIWWLTVKRVRKSKQDDVTDDGFTLQPKIHNLFLYFPLSGVFA